MLSIYLFMKSKEQSLILGKRIVRWNFYFLKGASMNVEDCLIVYQYLETVTSSFIRWNSSLLKVKFMMIVRMEIWVKGAKIFWKIIFKLLITTKKFNSKGLNAHITIVRKSLIRIRDCKYTWEVIYQSVNLYAVFLVVKRASKCLSISLITSLHIKRIT